MLDALVSLVANPFAAGAALLHVVLAPLLGATLAAFAIGIVGAVILLGVTPASVLFWVYAERRVMARLQARIGPNRVGPFGILQTFADTLKLLTKEDLIPAQADRWVFVLAPVVVVVPALLVFAVIPFGPGVVLADLDIGLLYLVAIGSISTVGLVMAGWASNNKYSLLGGMRAAAQAISYQRPLGLAAVGVVVLAGSLSLQAIAEAQRGGIAETNRTPFDLVEGESELVGGYHTEYSGMRFALFFLAEYMHAFALAAATTVLFFGGWYGPPIVGILLPPWLWFALKCLLFMLVLFWIRATLPRLRVDQLMGFGWKVLLPLALLNVFVAGVEAEVWRMFGLRQM
ncbi:MAG: NADH-quinone oxidoreductase subunit NuoH [Chloroflexi bacterium]|nr:NADH-quinone oxidoreductase subunit NuoH [Chloroflexota bacterium]